MGHWLVKCGYLVWGCSQVKSHCSLTSSPNTLIVKDVIVCPGNCQPCNSICSSASFHFLALLRNIFIETGRVGKALLRLIAVGENYLNVFWRIFQCEQQKCSSWIEMNKEAHKFVVNNQGPSSDDWNSCRTEEIVEADAWHSLPETRKNSAFSRGRRKLFHVVTIQWEIGCFLWSHHLLYLLYSALHHEQQPGGWQLQHTHKFQLQNGFREQS